MILAILQARMSSTRLPGKVLKPVGETTMLSYQIDRLRRSKLIDKLVVATSVNEDDNALEDFAKEKGVDYYRGDLNNVLDRYYSCYKKYDNVDHVVRLTGDCPVTDPQLIDHIIQVHLENKSDFSANTINPTFPNGLDAEVMTAETLEKIKKNANSKDQLEHVTLYVYQNKSDFKISSIVNDEDLSDVRWTLDTPEDYELLKNVIENADDNSFTWRDLKNKLC